MRRWLAGSLLLGGCVGELEPEGAVPCTDGLVCAIVGIGELGFNGDGLPALETRLASPTAVTTDPDGRVVVADYSNMRIRVLQDDGSVQTIVGNGYHAYSEIGVGVLETPLENPVEALWGPDGRLYVLSQHEGRVIVVNDDGLIERYAGTGVLGDSGEGGDALDADLGYGAGMSFASDGTLYVSDTSFSKVRRILPNGTIETVLGTGSGGFDEPGFGPEVAIRNPERIRVDEPRGRVLVADTMNHRVLAVDIQTLDASLFAGIGEAGYSGDGGPAEEAAMNAPVGIEVMQDGAVLISDLENHVIRLVTPDGIITTLVGTGSADPPSLMDAPLDFSMNRPAGMAWTLDGDLLIAERSGHRILIAKGLVNGL